MRDADELLDLEILAEEQRSDRGDDCRMLPGHCDGSARAREAQHLCKHDSLTTATQMCTGWI